MKKLLLVLCALSLLALVGCSDDSPTSPDTDEERLVWCLENRQECSFYSEWFVKIAGKPVYLDGARGLSINNITQEQYPFMTNGQGSSGEIRWDAWPAGSTFWLTVDSGTVGSLSWQRYDNKNVLPSCSAHPVTERAVICRYTIELVPDGVGKTLADRLNTECSTSNDCVYSPTTDTLASR